MNKSEIRNHANTIWLLLADKGALNICEIGELTNYKEGFIFLALGWLAKENKIRFFEQKEIPFVELNVDTFPVNL